MDGNRLFFFFRMDNGGNRHSLDQISGLQGVCPLLKSETNCSQIHKYGGWVTR